MESTQILEEDEDVDMLKTQACYHLEIRTSQGDTIFEDLTQGSNTIGREKDKVVIHLDSTSVSRVHAQIVLEPSGLLTIEDLGSANKTWMNSSKLQPHVRYSLNGDETLKFGSVNVYLHQGSKPPVKAHGNRSPILIPETPFVPKRQRSLNYDDDKSFIPASQSSPLLQINETHNEEDDDSFVFASQKVQTEKISSLLHEETQKLAGPGDEKCVPNDDNDSLSVFELSENNKSEVHNESGLLFLPTQKLNESSEDEADPKIHSFVNNDIKIKFNKKTSNMDEFLLDGIFSQECKSILDATEDSPIDQIDRVSDVEPLLPTTQELLDNDEGSECSENSQDNSQSLVTETNTFNFPDLSARQSKSSEKGVTPMSLGESENDLVSNTERHDSSCAEPKTYESFQFITSLNSHYVCKQYSAEYLNLLTSNEDFYGFELVKNDERHQSNCEKTSSELENKESNKNNCEARLNKASDKVSLKSKSTPKNENQCDIEDKLNGIGLNSISLLSHIVQKFYKSESILISNLNFSISNPQYSSCDSKKSCKPRRSKTKASTNEEAKLISKPTIISLKTKPPNDNFNECSTKAVINRNVAPRKRFSLDCNKPQEVETSKEQSSKKRKSNLRVEESVPKRRSTRLQKSASPVTETSLKENSKRKSILNTKDEPKVKSARSTSSKIKLEPLTDRSSRRNSSRIKKEVCEVPASVEVNVKPEPSSGRRTRRSKMSEKDKSKKDETINSSILEVKIKVEPLTDIPKRRSSKYKTETVDDQTSSDSSMIEGHRSSGRRRFKPVVLFSGYDDIKSDSKIVKDLGGTLTDDPVNCNLVVMDKLRRTVKLVSVVGKGVPIVDRNYLIQSKEAKYYLDPWKYLIHDDEFQKHYSCILRSTLKNAQKKGLLSDFEVYVTKSVDPSPSQFQSIIECSGGKFVKDLRRKNTEKVIVVSCPKDSSIYKRHIQSGFIVVSKEFLLTGILKYELDFKTFSLK